MRVDQLLVERGLAPSRSAAQRLVERGAVRWRGGAGWAVPRKAGDDLPASCELQVVDDAELRWASRAGLKLEAALHRTGLDVSGRRCLDVGQSTGGFTDVLLARGAAHVVGLDVGHGQLVARLRDDPRVTVLEGVNARSLETSSLPFPRYDVVVGDLSFISFTLVLPALVPLIAGDLLWLVKPQFELSPADVGKGGIVKDPAAAETAVAQRTRDALQAQGLELLDWFPSPVPGGDGNQEYFAWGRTR